MGFPIEGGFSTGYSASGTAGATISGDSFPTNQENDIILLLVSQRDTSVTAFTAAGYTVVSALTNYDAQYSAVLAKRVGATPEATVTVTSNRGNPINVALHVVRDGYELAAITDACASYRNSANLVWSVDSPTFNAAYANTLLLDFVVWDGTLPLFDPDGSNASIISTPVYGVFRWHPTADAVPVVTYKGNNNTNGGLIHTIAIRDKSTGGGKMAVLQDGREFLAPFNCGAADTILAPDDATLGVTAIATYPMGSAVNLSVSSRAYSVSNAAVLTNTWVGGWIDVSAAPKNISDKVISLLKSTGATTDNSRVGALGSIIVLMDAAYEWAAYQLLSQNLWVNLTAYDIVIQAGKTSALDTSSGSVDLTDVNYIGLFYLRNSAGTATVANTYSKLFYGDSPSVFVYGSAENPISAGTEHVAFNGIQNDAGYMGAGAGFECGFQGQGQIVTKYPIQYGDGTTPTYVVHTGESHDNPTSLDKRFKAVTNYSPITIKGSSTCVFDLRSAIYASQDLEPFTIDAASSLSASLLTTGISFIGRTFSDLAGYDWTSASWTECATVTVAGGNLTNCTIASTVSANAALAITANGSTIDGCTIDGTGADYALELADGVTAITLTDCTLTAGLTDKIHVLKTTGTVTITISGTTSLAAGDVTSAGATVVISAPLLYQTVTVSGATAGSRIQIYDTTSSTELYNGTPTFPYTWTDSVAAAADRAIRLRVSYVSGATAKEFIEANIGTCGQTSGTAAVSYLVNQVADTTYNSNAIDGPAIYATSGITFTDAATDRVNCNIGGGAVTYKTIYACFVYWNFTATGIANDFTYISAPDTANYILSGMKIRNTSAVDLSVTSGYGRDATTGASVDIIDTAGSTGNIFLAPDHVVPYQTTGTYAITGDISTVLAAIPSASDNATEVWSNNKALTVPKFLGLK